MVQQKLFKIKKKRIEEMTYQELKKERHEKMCKVITKSCEKNESRKIQ